MLMKTITKFVAKDGAEFLFENDAIEREKLIDDVESGISLTTRRMMERARMFVWVKCLL